MQALGFAMSCLLQTLVFWPCLVCHPPACQLTFEGEAVSGTQCHLPLVGWTPLLALHTSFPYNLWETISKVFTDSVPLDWCHSVTV